MDTSRSAVIIEENLKKDLAGLLVLALGGFVII